MRKYLPMLFAFCLWPFLLMAEGASAPRAKKWPPPLSGRQGSQTGLSRSVAPDAGSPQAPLLFCVGIHIEPFGAKPSSLVEKPDSRRLSKGREDYNDPAFLRLHCLFLRQIAMIVEKHHGKMTVQAQTPFTSSCCKNNEPIIRELAGKGHEIGLHFHEDAHLGSNSEKLAPSVWSAVMREEIEWLRRAGAENVSYWSGGNIYPHILEAASSAGLTIMSDYKNPRKQEADPLLLAVNPWRPAGEPREGDVTEFARHDPAGKIIYLPDGIFRSADFKERKANGIAAYFDYLTDGLERSLYAANKDKINVFHITLHPGELKAPGGQGVQILDDWLTRVIDPLVAAGKLQWATFSEMAGKYAAWEKQWEAATSAAPSSSNASTRCKPYITFAINTHDWVNLDESANTILKLVDIFSKYKVRGDFYLTAPITEAYAQKRPEVIKVLKESGMTISYHVRPPSPIYLNFDQRLKALDDAALKQAVKDYETYRLDLATGDLDRSKPGGYTYVAKVFQTAPVCVSPQCDQRIRRFCEEIYYALGARMEVLYHEEGTHPDNPFQYRQGLLVRPSDFSITRWRAGGGQKEVFWWDRLMGPDAREFDPLARLKSEAAGWRNSRPPFITVLIHENNFYNSGPESWKAYYFSGRHFDVPLSAPYNLHAPNPAERRSPEEQRKIMEAYESMVAYAAANMNVVTSRDIVKIAQTGSAKLPDQ